MVALTSSRHGTMSRRAIFGALLLRPFKPRAQSAIARNLPALSRRRPRHNAMSCEKKGNWAKTSVEEWRDAVYHPGSFFEELTRDTIAYVKHAAVANGINPADTALIEVGAGTGDILFALGDTFERLVGKI